LYSIIKFSVYISDYNIVWEKSLLTIGLKNHLSLVPLVILFSKHLDVIYQADYQRQRFVKSIIRMNFMHNGWLALLDAAFSF